MGPAERERARARRRRRQIFHVLLELTGLTFIIGLFPPLRAMLYAAVLLAIAVVVYACMLVKIKADEQHRAAVERRLPPFERDPDSDEALPAQAPWSRSSSAANGHRPEAHETERDRVWGAGVEIIDDDVHVVVRRADELEKAASGS